MKLSQYSEYEIPRLVYGNINLQVFNTSTSNRAIYYNLQNTCFSLLIDLDTLIIMSPKIDAPYLLIRPLGLVPLNVAYRLL